VRPTLILLSSLLLSTTALAQHSKIQPQNPIGPAKKSTTPPPASEDPLSGPAITENPKVSIVELDANGRLIRPEEGPEVAAYRKLDLTDEQRAPIEAILTKRAAAFDVAVRDNIELLTQLQSARIAGDAEAYRKTFMDVQRAFRPVMADGPIRSQISKALPADQSTEYEATLRQYWRAVYDEAVKLENAPAPTDSSHQTGSTLMADVLRREVVTNFGQEIDRSFKRITAQLNDRLETAVAELGLSDEQKSKVSAITSEYVVRTKLKPTSDERAEFFRRLLAELTPEQRKKLIAMSRPESATPSTPAQ